MIDDGLLITEEVAKARAPSRSWPDATSLILKHFTRDGKHLATTHCIKALDGTSCIATRKTFVWTT